MEAKEISKFCLIKRVKDAENHMVEVDENFKISKPTVLIIGGSGAITPRAANGNAKIVESIIGECCFSKIDLLSTCYKQGASNEEHDANAENIAKLIASSFIKDNKKISLKEALKVISQIIFFSHCFGDYSVFPKIKDAFANKLKEIGYNEQEINTIISQMFIIGYGSTHNHEDVKSLKITSIDDEMFISYAYYQFKHLCENLNKIVLTDEDKNTILLGSKIENNHDFEKYFDNFFTNNDRCYVVPNDNQITLISSHFQKDADEDHGFEMLSRKSDGSVCDKASVTGDYVSQTIALALKMAIKTALKNSQEQECQPFKMEELKEKLESLVKPLNSKLLNTGNVEV